MAFIDRIVKETGRFNRSIMYCKSKFKTVFIEKYMGFNRSIMYCKSDLTESQKEKIQGFNRSIMYCKCPILLLIVLCNDLF